ncbi:hypothetical protein [Salinithrix halophila]|uniref:Phage minor structural protein GP20 n=1 Tax=Salinithrix halophila TaxID=1485204 RepID=A0ABV8JA76_9BACL
MDKFEPLKMNLQFFADQGGDDGGDGADPQAGDAGDNNDPQDGGEEKTFTQDDINRIATKEKRRAEEKILKQLGVDNFDNAKEGLKKFREWQESQMSETEKQAERLKELEQQHSTIANENATLKAQMSAVKAGVNADAVADVVTLAKNLVDDETDMDAAIQKVVERYPHFKGEQEQEEKKPKFTTGQHQKQPQSDMDKWLEAFKR